MNSHKLFQADEAVIENDLLFDALFLRQPLQGKPISLAVLLFDMGVGGADDEINHVGVLGEDLRAEPHMTFSMPLLADNRPKVSRTILPSTPNRSL